MYQLIKILSRIICVLPRTIGLTIGKALGEVFWLIVPNKRRKMAIENIKRSLSVDEIQATAIAKQSTTRFGKMAIEVLWMPNYNKENMPKYVQLKGHEYLAEALSHGKGAVLATSHSGNWELLGAALTFFGFPLASVAQKQTNVKMDQLINEYRRMSGMEIIYKTGVRDMVKLLGSGHVIGIIMDQDGHSDGVIVDFFGRLSSTPQGAAALGRLKDAPIVPVFITDNGDGTHTGIFHPPVWVERTKDREQDILVTTQQLTTIIEQHIRKYPHEWFWLHNRWKHSPPIN